MWFTNFTILGTRPLHFEVLHCDDAGGEPDGRSGGRESGMAVSSVKFRGQMTPRCQEKQHVSECCFLTKMLLFFFNFPFGSTCFPENVPQTNYGPLKGPKSGVGLTSNRCFALAIVQVA